MTWSYPPEGPADDRQDDPELTDRHHRFLTEQVRKGVFASTSASVAAAVEQMIQDEEARQIMLSALADEVRTRASTPRAAYRDADGTFAAPVAAIEATEE